ncbi:MAG: phage scaffolding protein [Hungatella sp.]
MDWLKEILEKAVITDGKLDVDATVKAVTTEFPKHAVPKKDYNDKVKELETANITITGLKGENAGNAELQTKITNYETEITNLKTTAANTRKEYALKSQLEKQGVVDADYLIYKQGGVDKFAFDKDEHPIGVEDIIKPLKESSPHLFKAAPGPDYKPNGGENPPAKNPFAKDTFNMTEQGSMIKTNPEQAKQLAAAAGVTINI